MRSSDLYSRDFSNETLSDSVFSTTNAMLLEFPRDFAERIKPFPVLVFRYVDTRDFNSEVRKDIVLNDVALSKFDDLNHSDWIAIAWTRGKLDRLRNQNRKIKGVNYNFVNFNRGDIQKQVFCESEIEVALTVFCSSMEWATCVQEILSVNHIDGGFDFKFNQQIYRASYVPSFSMTEVSYVDRESYGNLVAFTIGLKINYPLVLNIGGGSLIKQIDARTVAISKKEMENGIVAGKFPDVNDGNLVAQNIISEKS